MESNKFDNSIKDKLESRSLQPSNNAWAKLSERLEKEDKKQNNKAIWWLGIQYCRCFVCCISIF